VARELRLGTGRRLDDVDPTGRWGLVGAVLSRTVRMLDLGSGRYVSSSHRVHSGRLRADGTIAVELSPTGGFGWRTDKWSYVPLLPFFEGCEFGCRMHRRVAVYDPETGAFDRRRFDAHGPVAYDRSRRYALAVAPSKAYVHCWDLSRSELDHVCGTSRHRVDRVAYDPEAGLMVIGDAWHLRVVEDSHRGLRNRERIAPGPGEQTISLGGERLLWLATAARRVVAVGRGKTYGAYTAAVGKGRFHFAERIELPPVHMTERTFALSPDGRLLAFASLSSDDVGVVSIDDGSIVYYDGHTDNVRLVAFSDDGSVLISADDDNRVIIRPRIGSGRYATTRVEVPVAA
jgi:hypothetical protein